MDFTAIERLRLCQAFADESKFKVVSRLEDLLDELFECDCRGCLFVYDDAVVDHSLFVHDTGSIGRDKMFCISNPNRRNVFLWHIDGVLFKKDSKCDCALLTDRNLCFIEFKSNASNDTLQAIAANYQKASSQLQSTLEDVRDRCQKAGVRLTDVVCVDAYAVFNRSVPCNDALRKNLSVKFLKATGVKLHFSNQREL